VPNPYLLPLIAGVAIAGAAAGMQLGHAAIAEIKPAYFEEPQTRFHADLVPYRSPDWAQVQAQEYNQPPQVVTQDEAMPGGCVGCRTWPVEYVPRHDPTVDRVYASDADDREYREAMKASRTALAARTTVVVYETPSASSEHIARYASYPVSREEAAAAQPQAGQAQTAPPEDDAATQ
jgi:hypothetical protein